MKFLFPDYIKSPFLPYTFEDGHFKVFNERKKTIFIILNLATLYEAIKNLINGMLNSNLIRFYIGDLIFTFSRYQALFDLSFSTLFIFYLRTSIYLYLNQNNLKKFKHLHFLKITNEEELIEKYHLSKEDAINYFNLVDFLIKIVIIINLFYSFAVLLALIRFLIASYQNIPFKWFILSTLPNSINYLIIMILGYNYVSIFYLVFFLNTFFTNVRLRSYSYLKLLKIKNKRKLNILIKKRLATIDQIINDFKLSQNDFDFTICSYSGGGYVLFLSFPFILLFKTDDILSKFFSASLYLQGVIILIWTIFLTNSYSSKGV